MQKIPYELIREDFIIRFSRSPTNILTNNFFQGFWSIIDFADRADIELAEQL